MPETDRTGAARAWVERFAGALDKDAHAVADCFAPVGYWRDLLAFTWNIRTMEGREAIRVMAAERLGIVGATGWTVDGEAWDDNGLTAAWISFETAVGRGRGHLRLGPDGAFTLLTTLQSLKGFEEKSGASRTLGTAHGPQKGRRTWAERRRAHDAALGRTEQPHTLIVGGGQGGIALAARLRRLGVPNLVIEQNARPGDSWRNRYRTLVLHDPVWYDHLPYLPFPDDWPVFTPKDKMGDWLEAYVKIMELDYWGSTMCKRAAYNAAAGAWEVDVERAGERMTLRPRQLVLATGFYGGPRIPEIAGADTFAGTVMHSSAYQTAEPFAGKHAVVIGSNTSAHDICADLWEAGAAEVTMIQRSSSMVVTSDTLMDVGFGDLYSERAVASGIDTDTADMLFASVPFAIMAEGGKSATAAMAERDRPLLDRLEAAGFRLDFGHDGSGLLMKAWRTGSGYYIDVGCSELIARGDVKIRSGVEPVQFTPAGLVLSDGSEIDGDVVICATGYHYIEDTIGRLLGAEVATRLGHCWGYGSGTPGDPGPWEGEMRNLWKPTAQPALWLHGGNLHLSRFFSKFVALQIKARMEGIPTPVYGDPSNFAAAAN